MGEKTQPYVSFPFVFKQISVDNTLVRNSVEVKEYCDIQNLFCILKLLWNYFCILNSWVLKKEDAAMNDQEHHGTNSGVAFGEASSPMVLASTGQRLRTMFLDTFFYFILFFVFGLVMGLVGLGDLIEGNLLGAIIFLIYYIPQEAFSGRTLGKLITGTKAISEDGTELTFGQVLGRTLCRFIPFEAFSFLGGNGRPRGWHDKIPKTKVISVRLDRVQSMRPTPKK